MHKKPCFLTCDQCKNVVSVICASADAHFSCCGQDLHEMEPNTSEGAGEKHIPVVEQSGNQITVKVGSVAHPMTEEHSISWVYLETAKGGQLAYLEPSQEPTAYFAVAQGDTPIAAYAHCNLHGFWKTEI